MRAPKIHVCGLQEVNDVVVGFPNQLTIISIRGSRDPGIARPELVKKLTELVFDDIEEPVPEAPDLIVPGREHALVIYEAWVQAKRCFEKLIIIQCHAGQRRAPTAALGLLYLEALAQDAATAAEVAVEKLLKTNPFSCVLEILGVAFCHGWGWPGVCPSMHLGPSRLRPGGGGSRN